MTLVYIYGVLGVST